MSRGRTMSFAISMVVLALGMVLLWDVGPDVGGVDTIRVGLSLVMLGAIGALLSLLVWLTGPGMGGRSKRDERSPRRDDSERRGSHGRSEERRDVTEADGSHARVG
jgi:hypothetical protein